MSLRKDTPCDHGECPYGAEQQWIPVAERLPEEYDVVIVTVVGSDIIMKLDGETIEDTIKRIGRMRSVTLGFICSDGWYGADGYPMIIEPSVWMPLPKPWKGESDE